MKPGRRTLSWIAYNGLDLVPHHGVTVGIDWGHGQRLTNVQNLDNPIYESSQAASAPLFSSGCCKNEEESGCAWIPVDYLGISAIRSTLVKEIQQDFILFALLRLVPGDRASCSPWKNPVQEDASATQSKRPQGWRSFRFAGSEIEGISRSRMMVHSFGERQTQGEGGVV
jgi:hypothetical protein